MSSNSSATSPEDAVEDIRENAVDDTKEDATTFLPASGDTRPRTMPLPASDGVTTNVLSTDLSTEEIPETPNDVRQTAVVQTAAAEAETMEPTDVVPSPVLSSASSPSSFSTDFDTDPFGRDGKSQEDHQGHSASADSAPASSASGTVWSAGTIPGTNQQPQAPQGLKGSTLLWGAFLLLVGGLLIAAGLGLRFDFTATAIACLAGLGVLLVVIALIPKRRRSTKP